MAQDEVKRYFDGRQYLECSHDRIVIRSMIVEDFLGSVENARILDIGCGDGSLSLPMLRPSNRLTLVDIAPAMIERARARIAPGLEGNVTLVNDSFEAVGDDERFDVVLCVGVIAHVPSVDALFTKIARVLKPGGRLVLETTPNPYPLGKLLAPYYWLRGLVAGRPAAHARNRPTLAELAERAKALGLGLLRSVRYSFPLPGMSHWSQAMKLRYTLFTLRNPLMSRLGTEHLLLYRREGA